MKQLDEEARLVRALKALADPKRFRMARELARAGELSCGQVGELFSLSQPAISHHLKILTDAGILTVREEGQHHFISVNQDIVRELSAILPARLAPPPAKRRRG